MASAPSMNLARWKEKISATGVGACILASPENVFYTTGAQIITQRTLRDRLAFSTLTPDADAVCIVADREESFTRQESWIRDIRGYVERKDDPVDILASTLREKGWHRGCLGFEARFLPTAYFERLRRSLPDTTFVPIDDVVMSVRAVKTPTEIERFRQAARATAQAIEVALSAAKVGDTAKSVNDRIMSSMLNVGADYVIHSFFATGMATLHPHSIAGDKRLTPGEAGRLDSGAGFGGYVSDLGRSLGVGPVPSVIRDSYRRLRAIERETIGYLRAGRSANGVFEFCRAAFQRLGLSCNLSHLGHSVPVVGGELHEEPNIHPYNSMLLEAGMVMNIEPSYRCDERGFALHVEDTVLVTEADPIIFSDNIDTEDLFFVK